jgi:hypothetical protein
MMSEVNKVRWREMNEMNFATKKWLIAFTLFAWMKIIPEVGTRFITTFT